MASFQKQSNKWTVRFRFVNQEGKEVHKRLGGFDTKKQAEQAYINFLNTHKQNQKLSENAQEIKLIKFENLLDEFFIFKASRVKSSTIYDLELLFAKNITPYFKNIQIGKIDKSSILRWQQSLDEKNFSFKYKTKLRWALNSFFNYLNKYYDVENVVQKVDNFVKPKIKKEINIWTFEQFQTFIKFTEEPYTTFFKTLYYLGLRLGECLALSPNDIDFKKNTVNINKSLTEKVKNKPYEIVSPKNVSSYRQIEMPKELANDLKSFIDKFAPKTFLFGSEKPFATTTLRRFYLKYITLAGVPKIKLHDFRHSHASLLIDLGANIVLIARRLGHADIEMTLNTYSHLMPNTENEIIKKLNNLGTI